MTFTKKYNLLLNNLVVQKTFNEIASKCDNNVIMESSNGQHTVDAKSILGFFSLNLNQPVVVTINDPKDADLIEKSLVQKNISFEVVA